MALFQIRWLRRLVRRHTNPIPEDKATVWKRRLSIGYALIAWNAFGFVCYMMYTGRKDWAEFYGYKGDEDKILTPGQQFAKQFGMNQAKVIRISGFKKTAEFDAKEIRTDLIK